MSARPWRLVRLRPTVPHVPVVAPGSLPRRIAMAVLPPIAERVRGRFGVRVLRMPGRVLVIAESMDALRDRVYRDRPAMTRRVGRVTLRTLWWRGPWRGWSGRVSQHPHLVAERVRLPRLGRGPATVDIRVEWPQPAGPLLAAAETALRPHAAGAASSSRWPLAAGPTIAAPARVLVDAQVVNPRGRKVDADQPGARRFRLDFDPRGLSAPTLQPWRRGRGDRLTWPAIAALRGIGAIDCPVVPGHDPRVEASLLAQLAMTGVVVHAPNLPSPVRDLIAPELTAILAEPLESTVDNMGFEVRSVRQRRTAIRWHSTRFGPYDDEAALPSVSALLATRRREYLDTILPAIAGQTYPNLEIVLCLHGMDLPESAKVFLDSCGRPYEVVRVDGDEAFGNALGLATARAGGALVTKFDDDDTYGPEHVWDLVLARHYAAATMVGKGAEFVYLEDAKVTVRRWSGKPEWDDTMVAGGTMLIDKADLEELGGWRPVARSVDRGLFDRVNRAGATVYRTHPLGYLYHRRPQGHTWDPGTEFFLQNTRQRWDGIMCPDGG